MKGIIKIKPIHLIAPTFKTRGEVETEQLLHKYRVLARKKQIEMMKLDSEYPWEPGNLLTYTHSERRSHFLKVVGEMIKNSVLAFRP